MKSFVLMLTFLTRIPVKIDFEITDEDFRRGIWHMPVIGLLIGLFLYAVSSAIGNYISPLINSLIIVALYIFITGGLHIDGLADTADSIFSCRDKSRMLKIMKDSRIGTFGVIAIMIYMLGLVLLLTEVPQVCLLFPLAGRSMALYSCATSKYARESGLGKTIVEGTKPKHVVFSFVLILATLAAFYLFSNDMTAIIITLTALLAVFIAVIIMTSSISKKLDGITGDVVGFIIEISSLMLIFFYYIAQVLAELIL